MEKNMFRIVIAVFLISFVAGEPLIPWRPTMGLNPLTPHGRIVGGTETAIEKHPWQASLQFIGFHYCGASIISKTVILTAAHCTSYPAVFVKVRVGSSRTDSGGTLYKIKEVIRHENYRTNAQGIPENDVAVLILRTPIVLDKSTQPVLLFAQNEESPEGVLATISGWGALVEGGSAPDVLQTVDVPIVTKTECSKVYSSWGGVPDGQICAAYPAGGKDTCQGDSGGPLVIGGRQAGIVSWGNGCAREGYPGVYTEIASFRNWLAKNAGV